MTKPVHQDEQGQWWFWDETWADRIGPYPNEITAKEKCVEYAEYLNQCNAGNKAEWNTGNDIVELFLDDWV